MDPDGTALRALANRTLRRRTYSVPAPNSMWHIDGNHKLIRYCSLFIIVIIFSYKREKIGTHGIILKNLEWAGE